MKKVALISAAAAATLAMAPSAFAAPEQTLDVTIGGKKTITAGTKAKPVVTKMTVATGTKLRDPSKATLDTIKYAKITLPKGIKLNYQAFPACAETQAPPAAYTCDESAPSSKVGSGTAKAAFSQGTFDPDGTLTPFIGTGGRLIIQTAFDQPAVIREGLIGKVAVSGGQYSFDFTVQESLQVIIQPDTLQQILDFRLNFDKKGSGKKGLIQLTSCPKEGYVFKGEFQFRNGDTATASSTVKCKAPKKAKKSKK